MLIFRVNSLTVSREADQIRVVIPTQHSTCMLTSDEARALAAALAKAVRKKRAKKGGSDVVRS